ncbi:MAG: hypothetical protein QNJ71_01580 [Acidimicrobiia bacterium]|nr:hypothetical protein [Acidimicrobiia bacterium]
MDVETIALIAVALFGVLAIFQAALALGAPLGEYAYGGRAATESGTLTTRYRIMSGVAVFILMGFAYLILARAGVIDSPLTDRFILVGSWAVVAYLALNTAANLMGKTNVERYVFGSITAVLVVLCAIVAAAGPS